MLSLLRPRGGIRRSLSGGAHKSLDRHGFFPWRGKDEHLDYRTAINTCLTWHRRNGRHSRSTVPLEEMFAEPADDGSLAVKLEELRILQGLISKLLPLEKAMITLWLDERSYDEIAAITGLSRANVAVKLHRVKDKLAKMAKEL